MWAFFHGWRRKAGVVTLLMALALMGAWIRSFYRVDCVEYFYKHSSLRIESFEQQLVFFKSSFDDRDFGSHLHTFSNRFQNHLNALNSSMLSFTLVGGGDNECFPMTHEVEMHRWGGFSRGTIHKQGNYRICFCVIPYWSLVLPLTLLSTYLILWKPRKLNQASTAIQSPQE